MSNFNAKLEKFLKNVTELGKNNSVPKWFRPFIESSKTFASDVAEHISELEGRLAVQSTVIDKLKVDWEKQQKTIDKLEDEIDDQQQYSRRTCLLIHGVKEKASEVIEDVAMDVLDSKLGSGVLKTEVTRTHRIGRKNSTDGNKPRPIIVRFLSYRQRKSVYDVKKKLKGQKLLVTESLTKKRYILLKRCFEEFGIKNCWSLDGRIYCKIGQDDVKVFTSNFQLDKYLDGR